MSDNHQPPDPQEGHQEPGSGVHHGQRRRRRRKVRKRIRIKKKTGPLRKVRKVLEKLAWVIVIIAFVVTLVVLMKQLDLTDKDKKKKKKKEGWRIEETRFRPLAAAVTGDCRLFLEADCISDQGSLTS